MAAQLTTFDEFDPGAPHGHRWRELDRQEHPGAGHRLPQCEQTERHNRAQQGTAAAQTAGS